MKNVKTILFGLAVLSMAACTRENMETPAHDNQNLVEVTIEAGIDNGQQKPAAAAASKVVFNDTGTGLEMNWRESGEAFSLALGGSEVTPYTMTQTSDPSNSVATFSGQLPAYDSASGNRGKTVFAFYPAVPGKVNASKFNVDLSIQSGKYDESKTYMYYYHNPSGGSANYADFMEKGRTVTFHHLVAILKTELDFGNESGTVENITFSADDMINSSNFKAVSPQSWLTDGQVVGNPVTFTEDVELVNGKATVYLYLIPGTVTDLSVKATVNHKEYNAVVKAGPRIIDAGKQYNISNVKMETDDAEITSLTILPQTTGYSYDGMKMEIGRFGETAALATMDVVDGRAVVPENITLNAGDKVWICIPKVAKFFHTLTADELSANIINLPEKNNGSTLLPEPTIAGKPYVNDWAVALYIGIDADNGNPLYWATGNLIAMKKNAAGEDSEIAYFIATKEITAEENGGSNSPYGLWTEDSATDGFKNSSAGTAWDIFQSATKNGARRGTTNSHTNAWSSANYAFGGGANDICTANLGGSWRLPSYQNEATGYFEKAPKLNSTTVDYYTVSYTSGTITNSISLPGVRIRSDKGNDTRKKRAMYMTGTLTSTSNVRVLDAYAGTKEISVTWCIAVRPVTE